MIFSVIGRKNISNNFGFLWAEIPDLFLPFLIMSLTAVFLAHSSMLVKWSNPTRDIFAKRILISLLQMPVALYSIEKGGALGILISLCFFNLAYSCLNIFELKKIKNL